jgi:iron complex outermembrane receptor protein
MEKPMIRYVLNTLGSFRSAFVVGVGLPFLIAASAYAQEATTERVIVTGSYIPTAETESALPVTVYTAEVLQKQGANTPVEGLRQLPSFVGNAATENDSNGGDGTATINLRGIGSVNTLILVNGRRTFNFNDINAIPIGALARTEVLKDGASSVYGSDGVAGVVNFILINGPGEKPYEGAELYAIYGNTTDTDAHVRQVYLRGGVTGLDGKVSIALSGEYYSRANLFSRDRDIAVTGDASNNPTGLQLGGVNSNSPTFSGRVSVSPAGSSLGFLTGTLVLNNLSNNQILPSSYRRFEQSANLVGHDVSRFNFRDFTPAIPAMEKAMYVVTGRYKVFGEGLQLYGDIMYSKVKQDNGLAGAPGTFNSALNGLNEVRQSSFNPFGNNLTSVGYRFQQEIRNRRDFFDKDYYRYVAGIQGDFNIKDNGFISHFGYDSGFVYERLNYQRVDSGDARRSYARALIAPAVGFVPNPASPIPGIPLANRGSFNPFIGIAAPITGTAPIYNNTNSAGANYRNGVPIGIGAYDNSRAALDWTQGGASYIGHSFFYERDWLADIKINAHLFPNLCNGGIDVVGGYESRTVNQKQIPDPVQASADPFGFNQSPPLKFRQEIDSWFFELGVPLVTSTMNIPFVRSLDLDFAWRREEFVDTNLLLVTGSPVITSGSFVNENPDENFGGSPRVSLRYQPIADVTLRASWGQSFRSPSPNDLFTPVFQNFPQLFDPIRQETLQPPSGVYGAGNAGLIPETTDAYSMGIVWTPKFFPGFTMTVDVYQLFTSNLIVDSDSFAQVLLSANTLDPDGGLDPVTGDPRCGLGIGGNSGPGLGVTRQPNEPDGRPGRVECIDSGFGNAGKRFVEGIDVTAVYELPTERFGKFTFSGGWNHFFSWKAQSGNGPFTSFLGNYNNGTLPLAPGAIPWNKGFLRSEWEWRHFDFIATGNYVGDFIDDPSFSADQSSVGGPDFTGRRRRVPSYITLDMQLSYEFVKPAAEPLPTAKDSKDSKNVMQTAADTSSIWQRILWGTTLTVGVNDAFDRQPPSVIGAFNDNYDTSLYTIRNRYWYVSLKKKF